ncbi:MAG: hypothetical protein AB8G22_06680 [Saprospiraceae bacterium]
MLLTPLKISWFSTFLLLAFGGLAQSGISVNNGKLFFDPFPGQEQTQQLLIANSGNQPITLQSNFMDWKRDSLGIKHYADAATLAHSCASWVTVNPPNIVIPANGKATVEVTVKAPDDFDVAAGVQNTMLFLRQLKNTIPAAGANQLQSSIQTVFQIGVHVYYTHPALVNKAMIINDLQYADGEKAIQLELENTGETILEAFMQFELTNMETGEEIKLFERSRGANFMPTDVRQFKFNLPENIPAGKYSVTSIVDIGADQDLLLGVLEIKI